MTCEQEAKRKMIVGWFFFSTSIDNKRDTQAEQYRRRGYLSYPTEKIIFSDLIDQSKWCLTSWWENMNKISFNIMATVHVMVQWTVWMRLNRFSADHDKTGHFWSNGIIMSDRCLEKKRVSEWLELKWRWIHFHQDRERDCSVGLEQYLFQPIDHLVLLKIDISILIDWVWRSLQYVSIVEILEDEIIDGMKILFIYLLDYCIDQWMFEEQTSKRMNWTKIDVFLFVVIFEMHPYQQPCYDLQWPSPSRTLPTEHPSS